MRFRALATDYDGTLARDGCVDPPTLVALARARASGLRLIMVTGRELADLSTIFPQITLFDRVVGENGAVLLDPATSTQRVFTPPAPPALVEWLRRHDVPVSVGHSILATSGSHAHEMLTAIRELRLEWHVVFNKGSVMVLPGGVNKATGLASALAELGVTAERTVGVGDGENDGPLLETCGLAVAVANAVASLKDIADWVTIGECGAGVAELIEGLRTGRLDTMPVRRLTERRPHPPARVRTIVGHDL
jgi:hydroxymethylpyrimidine pyrophosphatase-like HAD family hydrolase